jgi:hypothetical protein
MPVCVVGRTLHRRNYLVVFGVRLWGETLQGNMGYYPTQGMASGIPPAAAAANKELKWKVQVEERRKG